jgi:hypothetical protein
MWLKHATSIIDWHSIHAFLKTFYPKEIEYGIMVLSKTVLLRGFAITVASPWV